MINAVIYKNDEVFFSTKRLTEEKFGHVKVNEINEFRDRLMY